MNYLKSSKNRGPKFGCIRPLTSVIFISMNLLYFSVKFEDPKYGDDFVYPAHLLPNAV